MYVDCRLYKDLVIKQREPNCIRLRLHIAKLCKITGTVYSDLVALLVLILGQSMRK